MSDARDIARSLLAGRAGGTAVAAPAAAPAGTAPAAGAPAPAAPTAPVNTTPPAPPRPAVAAPPARPGTRTGWRLDEHPAVRQSVANRELLRAGLAELDLPSPYYVPHAGVNGATTEIFDGTFINFSGYNYLGLAGDPRVQGAAQEAIGTYGTSCSASRVVSGQIPLHRAFEERIATAYGVADAVVTGSGYLTNAAVIAFVLGPDDLAVCDSLVHNSIVAGTQWGHSQRMSFRHNDPEALETVLKRSRNHFQRAMVIVEGVYSMDGDIVVLPEIIEVARRYDCLVMVDEAHSFGVLGETGFGVSQHLGVAATEVDIWMGTLSKSMSSYGGFLAGSADFCEALRMTAPGISMYAAAPAPATMAAAITSFDIMVAEPWRLERLRANGSLMADTLRAAGIDAGPSGGTPVVPALIRDSRKTMIASMALMMAGVNANPILYPAVSEGEARIRFFVTAEHTKEQIDHTVDTLAAHLHATAATNGATGAGA